MSVGRVTDRRRRAYIFLESETVPDIPTQAVKRSSGDQIRRCQVYSTLLMTMFTVPFSHHFFSGCALKPFCVWDMFVGFNLKGAFGDGGKSNLCVKTARIGTHTVLSLNIIPLVCQNNLHVLICANCSSAKQLLRA